MDKFEELIKASDYPDTVTKESFESLTKNQHRLLRIKYNISKSELHSILINAFYVPLEIATPALKHYFTRSWESSYVRDEIHEGILVHNHVPYMVVYHQCTPARIHKSPDVLCSFRIAQDDFGLHPYVLIKPHTKVRI